MKSFNGKRFAVIIPTHGRADRVYTFETLRKAGYTGDIFMLCDDEDSQLDAYRDKYGAENVLVFSKDDYAGKFDKMDNFGNKACVVYARNAMWDMAREAGLGYFAVLDDDYTGFHHRITGDGRYYAAPMKNADSVFAAYLEFLSTTDIRTVCFAQGGDFIGGENTQVRAGYEVSRKMMNVYFFDVDRPIEFKGTINEDLTSSVAENIAGRKIYTCRLSSVVQKETQQNAGGLTDIYLSMGTYCKSFYSVMLAPSAVKISTVGNNSRRIHHEVTWKRCAPKLLRERHAASRS